MRTLRIAAWLLILDAGNAYMTNRLQTIEDATAMLSDEITAAQRLVRTDAYQMSIGEVVSMYDNDEIVIHPDFQRLFRWHIGQKSKLIESILLGIPLPSILVF